MSDAPRIEVQSDTGGYRWVLHDGAITTRCLSSWSSEAEARASAERHLSACLEVGRMPGLRIALSATPDPAHERIAAVIRAAHAQGEATERYTAAANAEMRDPGLKYRADIAKAYAALTNALAALTPDDLARFGVQP